MAKPLDFGPLSLWERDRVREKLIAGPLTLSPASGGGEGNLLRLPKEKHP
jgi:hypothetical protein